jgi:hypothetical protein
LIASVDVKVVVDVEKELDLWVGKVGSVVGVG